MEINGFRESKGKKWFVNIDKKENFNYEEIPSMSDNEMRTEVNKFFDKISPIIKSVEDKFMEHKDEIVILKNV